ncbi:MAG TPA: hypothetical protein VGE07_04220 [Herpetosiphonaceae bacterium]
MRPFPDGLAAEYVDRLGAETLAFAQDDEGRYALDLRGERLEIDCLDELLARFPPEAALRFRLALPASLPGGGRAEAALEIELRPAPAGGRFHRYRASCLLAGRRFQSPEIDGPGELEAALLALQGALRGVGALHACVLCVFSKTEAYGGRNGNGVGGHLHCFVGKREAYLRLCSAEELAGLHAHHRRPVYALWPVPPVDEFHRCPEFAPKPPAPAPPHHPGD